MKIAVLSGKGGAGKTFVAVNLAHTLARMGFRVAYADCDAEEPDGRVFFKTSNPEITTVFAKYPAFDADKCVGCRKCVEFCRFNALIFANGRPRLFEDACHSCGGCAMVCPTGCVAERERVVGFVEKGECGGIATVLGEMRVGEASAVPVIAETIRIAEECEREVAVLDCPPGTACPVIEATMAADFCVIVAEPTLFGLHDLRMALEATRATGKKSFVVVNKQSERYAPLEEYCEREGARILARIPYDSRLAERIADGQIIAESEEGFERFARAATEPVARAVGLRKGTER